jgi:hypothetical protein
MLQPGMMFNTLVSVPFDSTSVQTAPSDKTTDHLQKCMESVQELAKTIAYAMDNWHGRGLLECSDIHGLYAKVSANLEQLPSNVECTRCTRRTYKSALHNNTRSRASLLSSTCTCDANPEPAKRRRTSGTPQHVVATDEIKPTEGVAAAAGLSRLSSYMAHRRKSSAASHQDVFDTRRGDDGRICEGWVGEYVGRGRSDASFRFSDSGRGHAQAPTVNVDDGVHQDTNQSAVSHSPPVAPMPPYAPPHAPQYAPQQMSQQPRRMPEYYVPPSPDFRGRSGRLSDETEDFAEQLRMERRRRSRSRSLNDASSCSIDVGRGRGELYKRELECLERAKHELERLFEPESRRRADIVPTVTPTDPARILARDKARRERKLVEATLNHDHDDGIKIGVDAKDYVRSVEQGQAFETRQVLHDMDVSPPLTPVALTSGLGGSHSLPSSFPCSPTTHQDHFQIPPPPIQGQRSRMMVRAKSDGEPQAYKARPGDSQPSTSATYLTESQPFGTGAGRSPLLTRHVDSNPRSPEVSVMRREADISRSRPMRQYSPSVLYRGPPHMQMMPTDRRSPQRAVYEVSPNGIEEAWSKMKREIERGGPPQAWDGRYYCSVAPECDDQYFDQKDEWR